MDISNMADFLAYVEAADIAELSGAVFESGGEVTGTVSQ
jgi:hypothetical protein